MDKLLMTMPKILAFIKNNYLVIIIAAVIFLLFIPIIIISNLSPSQKNDDVKIIPTQSQPAPITIPPTTIPQITGNVNGDVYQEKTAKDSGPFYFSENSEMASESEKEVLSDGSIKYTMDSLNPNRSDILIARNGTIIFMRYTVVGKKISDGYRNLHGKQSHTLPGPTFYGTTTVIYFYEKEGTALTVDPKTGTTYEEFTFQPPISVEEFNSNYRKYTN